MKSVLYLSLIICSTWFLIFYASENPDIPGMAMIQSFQTDPCPPAHPEAKRIVEKFLTADRFDRDRRETGTAGMTVEQVTLLQKDNGASTCQALNKRFSDDPVGTNVYYTGGEHYFISQPIISDRGAGNRAESGWVYLIILDSDLNRIKKVALFYNAPLLIAGVR